jgi:hypothetical protein
VGTLKKRTELVVLKRQKTALEHPAEPVSRHRL